MNENNQSQIAGLQRKHALEAQNREANFDLETGFREKYQQAVLQNYRTRVDDANKNVGDVEQITGSLVAFSNTLAKKFTEYQEKKGEAEELAGFNAVFEFGITNEELNAIQATSAQIDAVDTAVNSTIQGLQERGVSAEQIAQLRGISGRRLVGAMKATALKGADDYPLFRAEHQDTMFQVGDQEFSLNTARNAGPQVWAAVNAQLRTEYMKKFRGIDPKFLNEYLFKGMRETENQEKMSFATDRQKMLSQQFQEEQMNELMTDWKGDGPQGVWNWIQRTSGGTSVGLRNQRLAAISILEDAAKSVLDAASWCTL